MRDHIDYRPDYATFLTNQCSALVEHFTAVILHFRILRFRMQGHWQLQFLKSSMLMVL